MTVQEIRAFKVDLLDEINTLATEPVPNDEEIRAKVNEFFSRLEAEQNGQEKGTSAGQPQ